jgi:hypothetical protein
VFRILSLLGAASAAWNIIHVDKYDDELNEIVAKAKWIQQRPYSQNGGDDAKRLGVMELQMMLTNYMKHFSPDNAAVEIIQLGTMYKILGDLDMGQLDPAK